MWNLSSGELAGKPITPPPDPRVDFSGGLGLAFSANGRLMAVAHGSSASVYRLSDRKHLYSLNVDNGDGRSKALAFSPDSALLATGGGNGIVSFWDGMTGRANSEVGGQRIQANAGWVDSLEFSTDGETLLVAGSDGAARLYDVASRQLIGAPLQGRENIGAGAVFGDGGTKVLVAYESGVGYAWKVAVPQWKEYACEVAGRTFTRAEWGQYLPDQPYEPVCRANP